MEVLGRVLNSPTISYPSETESVLTIQSLIASYLAHNGYVASARGFARDIEEEEHAFGNVGRSTVNGSPSLGRGLVRLEEGEEKELNRRQRKVLVAVHANLKKSVEPFSLEILTVRFPLLKHSTPLS